MCNSLLYILKRKQSPFSRFAIIWSYVRSSYMTEGWNVMDYSSYSQVHLFTVWGDLNSQLVIDGGVFPDQYQTDWAAIIDAG